MQLLGPLSHILKIALCVVDAFGLFFLSPNEAAGSMTAAPTCEAIRNKKSVRSLEHAAHLPLQKQGLSRPCLTSANIRSIVHFNAGQFFKDDSVLFGSTITIAIANFHPACGRSFGCRNVEPSNHRFFVGRKRKKRQELTPHAFGRKFQCAKT